MQRIYNSDVMKFIAIVASLASIAVAANVTTTVTCPDVTTYK
ncbi:hypothetical protein MY4824_004887 [Beauveria thailandica]